MDAGPVEVPEVLEFNDDTFTSEDLPSLQLNFPELQSIEEPNGLVDVEVQPVIHQLLEKHRQLGFEEAYNVTGSPKGLCCIINNKRFKDAKFDERSGTDIDRDNLKSLFEQLDYRVEIHNNLKAKEMLVTCKNFILNPEHDRYNSCVLVILSHGHLGYFIGTDSKKVAESSIFDLFNHSECRLSGKPKLVIVQACRVQLKQTKAWPACFGGNQPDVAMVESGEQIVDMIQRLAELNYSDELRVSDSIDPDNADLLIAHSTLPGYLSWRNQSQGSWFVQAIVEIFSSRSGEEHVSDMLVMVNNIVSRAFGQGKRSQLPCPVNHLRKKFYFFPNPRRT